jgi:DNA polymerase elongation subunit (family B)
MNASSSFLRQGEQIFLKLAPYEWIIKSYDTYLSDQIEIWCLDEESKPYLLMVDDFPNIIYVSLPNVVDNRIKKWLESEVAELFRTIEFILSNSSHQPIGYYFYNEPKPLLYSGEMSQIIRLQFRNWRSQDHASKLLRKGFKFRGKPMSFNVHEDQFNIIRKLLTERSITHSGWFNCQAWKIIDSQKISTLEREYIVDWTTISPSQDQSALTQPGILCMDIETYSDNYRKMPDNKNSLHVAYMISCVYQRYQQNDTRKRYGIICGDCGKVSLDNTIIYSVNNEIELVNAYAQILQDCDPEIISGYNILGYDYPYLDQRLKNAGQNWPVLGRIKNENAIAKTNSWSSNAYGEVSITHLSMPGRISVDLLPIIKRDYKFDDYKLETVSQKFLNKGKHDVTPAQMFKYYEDISRARYHRQQLESSYVQNSQLSNDSQFVERWNTVSAEYNSALDNITKVMAYCIQDSELVLDLMHRLDTWAALVQMSAIVGVTIYDTFTRGQQIRVASMIYNQAHKQGYIVNKALTGTYGRYTGGAVSKPIVGVSHNVLCLDFTSLYPSIIRANNFCYTTLIPKDREHLIDDQYCNIISFSQEEKTDAKLKEENDEIADFTEEPEDKDIFTDISDEKKKKEEIKVINYTFKFLKAEYRQGVLPTLLTDLTNERKKAKNMMAAAKNPSEKRNYDMRQLALKTASNSVYGFLAVRNGALLPLHQAAMCVTALGRRYVGEAADYVKNKYNGQLIYGDTDSIMKFLALRKE